MQILDVLNTASNEGMGGKGRRERPDPVRRHTAVTCVCAAALAGLDTLARKFRGMPTLYAPASLDLKYRVPYRVMLKLQ